MPWDRTFFRVHSAALFLDAAPSLPSGSVSRNFVISMYQSQNSSHRKSWIFETAIPSSYRSIFSVTSFVTVFSLDRIQRSAVYRSSRAGSAMSSSGRFIMMKRLAFQILFAKFRLASTCS